MSVTVLDDGRRCCPMTYARQKLEAEDERTSRELAERLNLKSVRKADAVKPTTLCLECGRDVPEAMRSAYCTRACRHRGQECKRRRVRTLRDREKREAEKSKARSEAKRPGVEARFPWMKGESPR